MQQQRASDDALSCIDDDASAQLPLLLDNGWVQCPFCKSEDKASFKHYNDAYVHARVMHADEIENVWVKCMHCLKLYPGGTFITMHETTCSERKLNDDASLMHEMHEDIGGVKCELCNLLFQDRIDAFRHASVMHHNACIKKAWVECRHCMEMYPPEFYNAEHRQECENKFKMDACDDMFDDDFIPDDVITGDDDDQFRPKNDTWISNYVCPICNTRHNDASDLTNHLSERHGI